MVLQGDQKEPTHLGPQQWPHRIGSQVSPTAALRGALVAACQEEGDWRQEPKTTGFAEPLGRGGEFHVGSGGKFVKIPAVPAAAMLFTGFLESPPKLFEAADWFWPIHSGTENMRSPALSTSASRGQLFWPGLALGGRGRSRRCSLRGRAGGGAEGAKVEGGTGAGRRDCTDYPFTN